MSNKKFIMLCLLATCLFISTTQNAIAGADWQEKQKQLFEQIPVKPGDVIDKSNWEKVKDLLPEPFIINGLKKGDWILNIGEFEYDHDFDAEYYELSARNKGKYTLGPKKEIIDVETGTFPLFIRGVPFPNIDMENDPEGPTKFMHNNNLNLFMQGCYAGRTFPPEGNLLFVGRNGFERAVGFTNEINYWWNRPRGEIPNPRKLKMTNFLVSQWPYDLTGTATLYVRHLDGRDDSVYCYVPAIRRVKRLSGANRSDPQMGSDQCMDDSDGFCGHIESMKWSYLGEKIMLKPIWKQDAKTPRNLKENKVGAWKNFTPDSCALGYQKNGWSGAPWAYTNLVWVPREMYIIKAEPLDPYYAYGKMELCLDKTVSTCSFNMKYTQAGEFWKYIVYSATPVFWKGGKKLFSLYGPSCVCDVRTDHASPVSLDNMIQTLDSPIIKATRHSPHNLKTATK